MVANYMRHTHTKQREVDLAEHPPDTVCQGFSWAADMAQALARGFRLRRSMDGWMGGMDG